MRSRKYAYMAYARGYDTRFRNKLRRCSRDWDKWLISKAVFLLPELDTLPLPASNLTRPGSEVMK